MDGMYMSPARRYDSEERFTMGKPNNQKQFVFRGLNLDKFFAQNRDIVRNVAILLVAVFVTNLYTYLTTRHETTVRVTDQITAQMRQEMSAAVFRTEQETLQRVKAEYGLDAVSQKKDAQKAEAREMAIAAWAYQGNTDEGLLSLFCCMKNRQMSPIYPSDIHSVVSQDQAFMQYSADHPLIERLYNLALWVVERYDSSGAPIDPDFTILEWSKTEIKLRDDWDAKTAHYFYESDWEEIINAA